MMDFDKWIEDWCWDKTRYKEQCLFVEELRAKNLNDEQIYYILSILDNICVHCFDNDSSCQCWNDE